MDVRKEKLISSRDELDMLFVPSGTKNGHRGPAHQQMREYRQEAKNRKFIDVRKNGGGAREQRRMKAKIDRGIVVPGYQGKVLRERHAS